MAVSKSAIELQVRNHPVVTSFLKSTILRRPFGELRPRLIDAAYSVDNIQYLELLITSLQKHRYPLYRWP